MSSSEYISLVKRKESPWWVSTLCRGIGEEPFKRALSWDFGIKNYQYKSETHRISVADASNMQVLISSQEGIDFYRSYLNACQKACKKLISTTFMSANQDARTLIPQQINEKLLEFMYTSTIALPFLPTLVLIQDKLEGDLRRLISTELRESPQSDEVSKVISQCIVTEREANTVLERRGVLEIAAMISGSISSGFDKITMSYLQTQYPQIHARIFEHVKTFGWLRTFTYLQEPFGGEETLERVLHAAAEGDSALKLKEAKVRMKAAIDEAEKIITNFKDEETRELLRLARQYLYWRFERVDVHFKAEVLMRDIEAIFARRQNVSRELLAWATFEELERCLKFDEALPVREMRRRQENGFDYFIENGDHSISTYEMKQITHIPVRQGNVEGSTITGATACLGRAKGTVRIVHSLEDMPKVELGDVLVTAMTTPDLMLAIERSSAIITDEGGVLCHAAIISRELNMPCVIGTQNATSCLRDGDVVEVIADAAQGKITILQQSTQ